MKLLYLFGISIVSAVSAQTLTGPKHGKKVVCYLGAWAATRPHPAKFVIEDLDPTLCTHVVYSFAGIDNKTNTLISLDPYQDLEASTTNPCGQGAYRRLVALKKQYPHLKVTLAVGGWNEGPDKFSVMSATPESRAVFIRSVLLFLDNYKFDGLDLDWEYPTDRGGPPYDKANFVLLVKELSEAFEPYGYILTAAVATGKWIVARAYDLAQISRYVDLVHLMCYDHHEPWTKVLAVSVPLWITPDNYDRSVEFAIDYMMSQGVPADKIVVGLAIYGRTILMTDPNTKELEIGKTPTKGFGFAGPYSGEPGLILYNEICVETSNKSSPWEYHWHDRSFTPFLRNEDKFITYDDGRSIVMKVKMAIDKGVSGVMIWSIDSDDFKGKCTESNVYIDFQERYKAMIKNPLLGRALRNLDLPDEKYASLDRPTYVLKNKKLHLHIPKSSQPNYFLVRTVNDAISLALEEKRIEDAIERVRKEIGIDTSDDNSEGIELLTNKDSKIRILNSEIRTQR